MVERARAAGCPTLVLTVDLPVVGHRYRDVRNGVSGGGAAHEELAARARRRAPPALGARRRAARPAADVRELRERPARGEKVPEDFQAWVAGQFDPSVTWDDLAWLREHWPGRLALKGILDPEDARRAVDHGVDGVIVSNHGGRQLDGVPSSRGGARPGRRGRGGALRGPGRRRGAQRPGRRRACWRSARGPAWSGGPGPTPRPARGERGVSHVLAVLRAEILVTLGLTGVTDVAALDRSALVDPPF